MQSRLSPEALAKEDGLPKLHEFRAINLGFYSVIIDDFEQKEKGENGRKFIKNVNKKWAASLRVTPPHMLLDFERLRKNALRLFFQKRKNERFELYERIGEIHINNLADDCRVAADEAADEPLLNSLPLAE